MKRSGATDPAVRSLIHRQDPGEGAQAQPSETKASYSLKVLHPQSRHRLIELSQDIAFAAATDAGNRSMRKAGRERWSEDDVQVAAEEFWRLFPEVGRG